MASSPRAIFFDGLLTIAATRSLSHRLLSDKYANFFQRTGPNPGLMPTRLSPDRLRLLLSETLLESSRGCGRCDGETNHRGRPANGSILVCLWSASERWNGRDVVVQFDRYRDNSNPMHASGTAGCRRRKTRCDTPCASAETGTAGYREPRSRGLRNRICSRLGQPPTLTSCGDHILRPVRRRRLARGR